MKTKKQQEKDKKIWIQNIDDKIKEIDLKLADRQDYLVNRLTNGEQEFLDMLEEFYDISIILNSLVKKEQK